MARTEDAMADQQNLRDREAELFHDWNTIGEDSANRPVRVELDDESLRDGLQGPSVHQPTLDQKLEILHAMAPLGIRFADIGYPAASPVMFGDVVGLAREIAESGLDIEANCAARSHKNDILPIAEAQQQSGVPIEASIFLGSSPIRQYVEGWDLAFLLRTTEDAVRLARSEGLEVMFVTEDTTRADPEVLRQLYTVAIESGARRICLADTVGHANPWGVQSLVRFAREVVAATGTEVKIDFHGHRDRGLSVMNSLAALAEGADRVHGCGLGIGERSGNTPMELLLVNLKLLGWLDSDLRGLPAYCEAVSRGTKTPIARNAPAVGSDAFETSTGVHAAALLKAQRAGAAWLADRIYSGVPAAELGREQSITVGPMSGQANAIAWLTKRDLECTDEIVDLILSSAKAGDHVLTEGEIYALLGSEAASERMP
jgi:2-isopropylmalate synthase